MFCVPSTSESEDYKPFIYTYGGFTFKSRIELSEEALKWYADALDKAVKESFDKEWAMLTRGYHAEILH